MAARRVVQSTINWSALADRVPTAQRSNFVNFKTRSDIYMRAVMANPENPPKIDWAHYKKLIPLPGLVDSFQKQYEALKVPYPQDSVSSQIDFQIKETQSDIDIFKQNSNVRIAEHEKEIKHLQSLLPYDQMTMEDYCDAFPDQALDPLYRPTFWPHNPEEQLDYKPKDQAASH